MARCRVLIKPSAVKELEALPARERARVVSAIRRLSDVPRPPGCEKLSAQERYRIRQGRYRVLYAVDDTNPTLTVVKIGHRRDVYRR